MKTAAPSQILHSVPPPSDETTEEGYVYDPNGNRSAVLDAQADTISVVRYNLLNLPESYVGVQGDTVRYVYSADGEKLFVQENPQDGTTAGTEYAANYRIENGTVTMIHTDATGTIRQTNDYTPFGGEFNEVETGVNTGLDHRYDGKEKYYSISPYAYCANNPVNKMAG